MVINPAGTYIVSFSGRFREFYYWDTYWIVKALLQCDMVTTVKGILENFLLMVSTYGLVRMAPDII